MSLHTFQLTSDFTLFELGFNFDHTKPLCRLLRNRGILAGMPFERKMEMAKNLLTCSFGPLAFNLHHWGRADMHKLAKEAFVCIAESCTQRELQQVMRIALRMIWNDCFAHDMDFSFVRSLASSESRFLSRCHPPQIIAERGGYRAVQRCLRGWLFIQGQVYERRLKAAIDHLKTRPEEPAYPHTK